MGTSIVFGMGRTSDTLVVANIDLPGSGGQDTPSSSQATETNDTGSGTDMQIDGVGPFAPLLPSGPALPGTSMSFAGAARPLHAAYLA